MEKLSNLSLEEIKESDIDIELDDSTPNIRLTETE